MKLYGSKEEVLEHTKKDIEAFARGRFGRSFERVIENVVLYAYNAGMSNFESNADESYQRGVEAAWEVARVLHNMTDSEKIMVFDVYSTADTTGAILEKDGMKMVSKYLTQKAIEAEQDKIEVGDVVIDPNGLEAIVTNTDTHYHLLYKDSGKTWKAPKDTKLTKTGKSFDVIGCY